jgi:glycine/D-amino acid oxidase-like deaminating enzyme
VHLAERNIRSIVIEAKEIGHGASGRNFGQVVPYLKHDPDRVISELGHDRGERLIDATGKGPDLVFGLIEKYQIDCAAVRTGLIFAAHADSGRAGLERRTAFWQGRGAQVAMFGAAETAALIGSSYYQACSLDRRGGTINPLAFTRGLARAAIEAGANLFTGSPATAIERNGHAWRVSTPRGSVVADTVVLATDVYTTNRLWPSLRDCFIPVRLYQAVSRPLGENVRRTVLPQGQPLTDTRRLISGLRLHADGRLHASADGAPFDNSAEADLTKVERRVATVFPRLGPIEWEHRWAGWVGMTFDQYPKLHELAPGMWIGFGYSGRGIAHATMMGRDIAARLAGAETDLVFSVSPPHPRKIARLAKPMVGGLMAYYRVRDAIDATRHSRARAGA